MSGWAERIIELAQVTQEQAEFERANAEILNQAKILKNRASELEKTIREEAMGFYVTSGMTPEMGELQLHPALAVKVRMKETIEAEYQDVRTILEHHPHLLKTDMGRLLPVLERVLGAANVDSAMGEILEAVDIDIPALEELSRAGDAPYATKSVKQESYVRLQKKLGEYLLQAATPDDSLI